jgi:GNAT superfamily N-acetyltransferase
VPHLRAARRHEIAAIFRESHGMWGAGLTYPAYLDMWLELMETPWARGHFRHLAWVDDDETVLSSLKLYRPVLRLLGRTGPAAMLGAVFTPRGLRRRGHAADLVRAVLEEARAGGDSPALLFSDIGIPYYEALGFRALPAEEAAGRLERIVPPPAGWEFRVMTPGDLPDVLLAHEDAAVARPIAVVRDRAHWEFLLARAAGYFKRLDGSDLSRRYRIALFHGRFAGYLVSLEGEAGWAVREVGAPGADPAALSAILRRGAVEARRAGLRKVHGWLPREAAEWVPEWRLAHRPRRLAIPMLHPLAGPPDWTELEAPGAAFLPYLDQF